MSDLQTVVSVEYLRKLHGSLLELKRQAECKIEEIENNNRKYLDLYEKIAHEVIKETVYKLLKENDVVAWGGWDSVEVSNLVVYSDHTFNVEKKINRTTEFTGEVLVVWNHREACNDVEYELKRDMLGIIRHQDGGIHSELISLIKDLEVCFDNVTLMNEIIVDIDFLNKINQFVKEEKQVVVGLWFPRLFEFTSPQDMGCVAEMVVNGDRITKGIFGKRKVMPISYKAKVEGRLMNIISYKKEYQEILGSSIKDLKFTEEVLAIDSIIREIPLKIRERIKDSGVNLLPMT